MFALFVPAAPMNVWTHRLESLLSLKPAHVYDARGQLYNKAVWDNYARFYGELLSDENNAMFVLAPHPAFQQLAQRTMAMGIGMYSTLDAVRKASLSTLSYPMVHASAMFVIVRHVLGMPKCEIARALAVELSLPLTYNDAIMPMTPPPSPSRHAVNMGNGCVTEKELVADLAKHYINSLLPWHTDPTDFVALVAALAKLCEIQAERCQERAAAAENHVNHAV
ncbi:hypothetical protein GGF31_005670 [Allomyces arbusculus]|nr:hypothetical protein GGF31_005670 [Allomyces arbusculus]